LKSAVPKQIVQYPFISRESGSGTREVIDHYLQKAGIPPESLNVVMELGSPEALKGLVATGMGFTIMSRVIVEKELQLGQLVQIPLRPRLLRNFSVVYAKERFHSRLVAGFLAFAKDQLAAAQRLAA
ncbi:MAG TPA: LysR substrate-binding domain-containing protein, partial [Burkholderiales bacterium]|nr:LysR substrate-binding domain-containing protein [Burkholderiales bacterium]